MTVRRGIGSLTNFRRGHGENMCGFARSVVVVFVVKIHHARAQTDLRQLLLEVEVASELQRR